jgi:hypothetical protein
VLDHLVFRVLIDVPVATKDAMVAPLAAVVGTVTLFRAIFNARFGSPVRHP